jgi:hypothetical protein
MGVTARNEPSFAPCFLQYRYPYSTSHTGTVHTSTSLTVPVRVNKRLSRCISALFQHQHRRHYRVHKTIERDSSSDLAVTYTTLQSIGSKASKQASKDNQIDSMTSPYPYTRREECSWHPEDAARHLACLASNNASLDAGSTQLLSHGWSTRQIETLRRLYGTNSMQGDKGGAATAPGISMDRYAPCLPPICSALVGQLKEPLILMLLGSAGISIIMGNKADAISIGIALLIVSFVAAVQEYRSEQALEKLANLVPHTCTVLRDGQVNDHFLARELVVGDLVLLATGE